MFCHIQYLSDASVRLMHTPDDTIQVEPSKIDGENPFQDRRKEKRWQGDTDQREYRHRIVRLAVLLCRGNNSQRNRYHDFQDKRHRT